MRTLAASVRNAENWKKCLPERIAVLLDKDFDHRQANAAKNSCDRLDKPFPQKSARPDELEGLSLLRIWSTVREKDDTCLRKLVINRPSRS
jgi:hypothetical protein